MKKKNLGFFLEETGYDNISPGVLGKFSEQLLLSNYDPLPIKRVIQQNLTIIQFSYKFQLLPYVTRT